MTDLVVGVDARELQGQPTGTGRYLGSLLRVWTRTTADRFLLYFNGPAPVHPLLDHPRVAVRELGIRPISGSVWQEARLPAAARADGLDVFFSPAYTCPIRLGLPRVTAVHDLSFVSVPHDFTLLDGLRRRLLVSWSVRASRRILACSEFTRREILTRYPDAAGKVAHVPLGPGDDLPPPPSRDEARARLRVRGPLLLSVGAVLNRRRLPVLLRAIAVLARRRPDLRLDVVGENRTHPPLDLPALARELGIGSHVRFAGFVSDAALADRYAAADAAIFLSEYEGFGLPALEAMARGLPVIVSDRPALSEIFGEAALVVDPGDAPGIAVAVDGLLGDAALRAQLVERGRQLAARHTWERTAALTRQAFLEACR